MLDGWNLSRCVAATLDVPETALTVFVNTYIDRRNGIYAIERLEVGRRSTCPFLSCAKVVDRAVVVGSEVTTCAALTTQNIHLQVVAFSLESQADSRTVLEENGSFGRQLGVSIDVFPVDGLPKDEKKIDFTVSKMKALWGLVVCATVKDISKRSTVRKIEITLMRWFYRLFPLQSYFTGLTIREAQKIPFDNSEKVATLVWGYGKREVISRTTATEYIKADFESYRFNIPRDYEDYLIHIYGDYWELPPESERVYKHHAEASWKTVSQE